MKLEVFARGLPTTSFFILSIIVAIKHPPSVKLSSAIEFGLR